jgi:hypothetical protein
VALISFPSGTFHAVTNAYAKNAESIWCLKQIKMVLFAQFVKKELKSRSRVEK